MAGDGFRESALLGVFILEVMSFKTVLSKRVRPCTIVWMIAPSESMWSGCINFLKCQIKLSERRHEAIRS